MKEKEIQWQMLHNAKLLVQSSLHLSNSNNDYLQSASLALIASAIEILLKAKLSCEHWSLIFDKIEDASLKNLQEGSFRSVSWNMCLKRLSKIQQEDLKAEEANIKLLMEYRNQILHYRAPQKQELFTSSIKKGYEIWQALTKKWNYLDCEVIDLEKEILTLKSLLEQNWKRFKTSIFDESKLAECPWCNYEAIQIGQEYLKQVDGQEFLECQVCFHKISPEELAEILDVVTPFDYESSEELMCPECEFSNTCAQVAPSIYLCTRCGLRAKLDRCMTCNGIYFEDETGMCPICLAHRLD